MKSSTDESIYHSLFAFYRLSFCKVTDDGGSSLVSALNLNPCSLKDLDLSFNNLTDDIVQVLKEKQRDSCCSLEKLKYGKPITNTVLYLIIL